jgi:hypothetical protein
VRALSFTTLRRRLVRALLDRMPDDCKLGGLIHELCMIETAELDEKDLPPLTQAQRDALDEAIAHQEAHPDEGTPWREALRRIERGE